MYDSYGWNAYEEVSVITNMVPVTHGNQWQSLANVGNVWKHYWQL